MNCSARGFCSELSVTMVASLACPCQALPFYGPARRDFFRQDTRHFLTQLQSKQRLRNVGVVSELQSPKGFGPAKKQQLVVKTSPAELKPVEEEQRSKEEEEDDDVIPEVVTNRMMKRIGLTVGVPLAVGVLGFPLYYYLKIVQKVDIPEWLPLMTSMFTFGTAGFGISYGIVSTSWDPLREGSLLGWKEAKANWPVFLENMNGKDRKS